jgi:hypothetical protein
LQPGPLRRAQRSPLVGSAPKATVRWAAIELQGSTRSRRSLTGDRMARNAPKPPL